MKPSSLFSQTIVGSGIALLTLTNCARISIQPLPPVFEQQSVVEDVSGEFEYKGSIQVGQKIHTDLDLVWVIDNSGSMADEIAHVRTNLDRFTETVGNKANLKMSLISKSGAGSLSLDLNITDPNRFMQIDQSVSSTNALLLAGAGFCTNTSGACSSYRVSSVQGQLSSFFRPNSKKVFVIVSDDESEMSPQSFTSAFKQTYPGQNFSLFGFVGLGSSQSPCQAQTGSQYVELAQQNQGQTFNICDMDWTSTFSTLADSVLSLVAPILTLPHAMNEIDILGIELNGKKLKSTDYQISSSGIVFDLSLLQTNQGNSVKVRYVKK